MKRFGPASWPERLASIRKRFGQQLQPGRGEAVRREREQREERSIGPFIEHGYIAEEMPAIVRFAVEFERVEEPREPAERERKRFETLNMLRQSPLAIVVLDIDYIKRVLVPALFKRRFTDDGALDYEVAVVFRRGTEERTEKSLREPVQSPSAGDWAGNLFIAGPSSAESDRGERWQILINHRAGSLDAAVAQARRRNLIGSFGILSLLAVSLIIVIVSSRRAQQLARKQMEFVAGVSHEFRTPLAVIHAVSENLADGLITDQRQVEECGAVIRTDVRRLAGMVEQVLEFAGASRGKSLNQPHAVDVTEVIEDVLARYSALESNKGLRVEKEFESNLPEVLVDRGALECAVRNILDNAVKYGGERDCWVGIKAHTEATNNGGSVQVTVEDKGIGIPASELTQIFEPFYRGRDVVAAQIHGNGLGLSLVKNAIEANGGSIAVKSSPGEGSAFTLSLPIANGHGQFLKGSS